MLAVQSNATNALKMIKAMVPITRFNKGEAGKIIEEVKRDGIRVIVKNNVPECIMITVEKYNALNEAANRTVILNQSKEWEEKRKAWIQKVRANVQPSLPPVMSVEEALEKYGSRPIEVDEEADRMLGFFQSFNLVTVDEYDWEFSGLMLQNFRQEGYSIPVTDVLIAYLGIKYDIPVWTKDHNFKLIQALYPELKLYEM